MQRVSRGYMIAFASAGLLAFTGIFIRHLTQAYGLPPLTLAFWRNSFVVLTLLPFLALGRPALLDLKRGEAFRLVIYGLALAIFNSLWTLSVALAGATVATVLVYSSGAFTVLLGWVFLGERLDTWKLVAVGLALIGCGMVCGAWAPAIWRANPLGLLAGVLSGLLYAIYTIMGSAASRRGVGPWTAVFYAFGFGACFLLLFDLASAWLFPTVGLGSSNLLWLGDQWIGWLTLFALAAGPTAAGFGLYNMSLGYLPASVVNLIVTLEPALTALVAYALLGERLTSSQMAGSLLVVSAVAVLRLTEIGRVSTGLGSTRPGLAPAPSRAEFGDGNPPESDTAEKDHGRVDQDPVLPMY